MNKLNKYFRAIFATASMLIVSFHSYAHDFEVNGIYYNYLDETAKTVAVTFKGSYYYSYSNEYTGAVSIPSSVTYNSTTYSVTSIGSAAFSGCSGLTSVTIPNSVTSIGSHAFSDCRGLTSVTIPNSVTYIGREAFNNTGWYNNQPDGILYLDNCCLGYKGNKPTGTLSIKEGTRLIGDYAFSSCAGLTSVTIGNSVTSIGYEAFSSCAGLTSVTIPNSVAEIDSYAFSYCDELKEVNFNAESCTLMRDHPVFVGCGALSKVNIGENVKKIPAHIFAKCKSLTDVFIGNSVEIIGIGAFSQCSSLTDLTIPPSVTSIEHDAFEECIALKNVIFKDGSLRLYLGKEYKNGWQGLFVDCPLDSVYLGRSLYYSSSPYDGYSPFYNKKTIKSVTVGDYVAFIGENAFLGCSGITSLNMSSSVTSIEDNAFSGCTGLTEVNITYFPHWCLIDFEDYDSNPLYYAHKLKLNGTEVSNVVIPNNITKINAYTFYNCTSLTSVKFPNTITDIKNDAFYGCKNLASITIPRSVVSIGDKAFGECENVVSIIVESGNDMYDSRDNCNAIIKTEENSLVVGCKNTVIPNSTTKIGANAFLGCRGLNSVLIPKSVALIDSAAFYNCGLRVVQSQNEIPPTCSVGAFGGDDSNNSYSALLLIPTGSMVDYALADEWCNFTKVQEIAGIKEVEIDNNVVESARYDIHGRLLNEPAKGLNIIKMSDGTTRKEVLK